MPKKLALCIGINDYPGTANDLSGCVNDANDWAAALTQWGFTVQKLLNKNATRAAILAAMKSVITSAVSGDSIVFQYSGHGSYIPDQNGDEPDGKDECLCPYDINTKGPITDDEIFDLFNSRADNVKLVFFSDSCHSGTVARFAINGTPALNGKKGTQRKVKFLPPATFLSKRHLNTFGTRRAMKSTSPPGKYSSLLLAGCQDTEYSYDAVFQGRPNGAFSFVALSALKKLTANKTYNDWFSAIRKSLPTQQYPQSPNLFGTSTMKKWKILG